MSDLDDLRTYRWPKPEDPGEPRADPRARIVAQDDAFTDAMCAAIVSGKERPRGIGRELGQGGPAQ